MTFQLADASATRIQARKRGLMARKEQLKKRLAATKIQASFRGAIERAMHSRRNVFAPSAIKKELEKAKAEEKAREKDLRERRRKKRLKKKRRQAGGRRERRRRTTLPQRWASHRSGC